MAATEIRDYETADAARWLRCRLLSFFATDYYDDVVIDRPHFDGPAVSLVVEAGDDIVGLIDVVIDGTEATIDCVAVLPDHQRAGHGARLLQAAVERLPAGVATLDAWTREDAGANAWYVAHGFTVRYRYVHVYKEWDEPDDGWASPDGISAPVRAFAHAPIEREANLRASHRRVYVCRRYVRDL